MVRCMIGKVGKGERRKGEWERARQVNREIPQIVPGSRVRLTADWGKLHAGEELEVFRLDGPGLIVSPVVGKREEFWIPASLVPNSSISRAWSFRPRRIDSEGESVRLPQDVYAEENGPPAILTIPCSIRATAGGVARLVLEARRVERAAVRWKKEGQRCDIEGGDRYRFFRTTDSLCLEIAPCRPSDSGIYHCRVEHETGSCSAKIPLCVVGTFARCPVPGRSFSSFPCFLRYRHGARLERYDEGSDLGGPSAPRSGEGRVVETRGNRGAVFRQIRRIGRVGQRPIRQSTSGKGEGIRARSGAQANCPGEAAAAGDARGVQYSQGHSAR